MGGTNIFCKHRQSKGQHYLCNFYFWIRVLGKTGVLWEKGYYDKGIHNEVQFRLTYDYIKNNALKAGLNDAERRFYGVYEEGVNEKGVGVGVPLGKII